VLRVAHAILILKLDRRDHLTDQDISGRILLQWILKKVGQKRENCIHLTQARDQTGSKWEDNIKMDHKETECGFVDLICLTQNRDQWRRALVNAGTTFGFHTRWRILWPAE
jgi:ferredoxin-like protein FixX